MFPRQQIVTLGLGPAQVTGRVIAVEPLLRAPLSGRSCVTYQVLGRNHMWPWHNRLNYPPSVVRFGLDDGSGLLNVVVPPSPPPPPGPRDARPAVVCAIAGEVFRQTIYAGEAPALDRLLDPGGFPFTPDAYMDAEERIVSEGDILTVGGRVFQEVTPDGQSLNYRSPPSRLVLQAQSIRHPRPR